MGNMYSDSVFQWNVFKGCNFQCSYCIPSFQRQAKRQKHRCIECYNYEPHFHPERLKQSLPNTKGDEFIWTCSSGDIAFAKPKWMDLILERIKELPNKTFFFQTKDPVTFSMYDFPENVILGITLETNEYPHGKIPTKAPLPWHRYVQFQDLEFPRKVVTIEPIMEFRPDIFLRWLKDLNPERIYIGYDTKKCGLKEPSLEKTYQLIEELKKFTKVKLKYLKGDN